MSESKNWEKLLADTYKEYRELEYNAYSILKDTYSIEDVLSMPIKDLHENIDFYTPKLKEISEHRSMAKLEAELTGKEQTPRNRR